MSKVIDLNLNQTKSPKEEDLEKLLKEAKTAGVEVVNKAEHGYVVAVMPDGQLAFQTIGAKHGHIELLGLHQFATYRLQVASDINQQYGSALVASQLNQVLQGIQVVLNMLTKQTQDNFLKLK